MVIGLIATILSALSYAGDPTIKNIWGAHFNMCSDTLTAFGAIAILFVFIKETPWSRWTEKEATLFLMAILGSVLAALGFLSAICSITKYKDSFGKDFGDWWVGFIFWITGVLVFFIGEIAYGEVVWAEVYT
jgi:hypothetical protein